MTVAAPPMFLRQGVRLFTENRLPAFGQDCCCICICSCGKLNEIFNQSGTLKVTVTDDNQPQQVTSDPDPIILNPGSSQGGCIGWVDTSSFTCDLSNATLRVWCDGENIYLQLTPESEQNACMFTNVRLDSVTCDDDNFVAVFKVDVAVNPNGPDPPTCVAPCDGTTVTLTIEPNE